MFKLNNHSFFVTIQFKHKMNRELTELKNKKDRCMLFYMLHGRIDPKNQYLLTKFKRVGGSVSICT